MAWVPGPPVNRQKGFTLLELLVAVTITAVIGLGVWQVVSGIVQSRDRVDEIAQEFDGLQRAMLLLERDITQVVNRPVRNVYGDYQPAMTTREEDFDLVLTRQGWRNPLGIRRSGLQRVAWEFTGTELRRRYWPMVDQGQEDDSTDVLLLENLIDFEVRFLTEERSWQDNWPTDQAMISLDPGSLPDVRLPIGLEIKLEHERFGQLVRTFALPDFDPQGAQGLINEANEASSQAADEQAQEQEQSQDSGTPGTQSGGGS